MSRSRLSVSGVFLLAALFLFCVALFVWLGLDPSASKQTTLLPGSPQTGAISQPVPAQPQQPTPTSAAPEPATSPGANSLESYPSGLDAEAATVLSRLAAELELPPVARERIAQRLTLMPPAEQRRFLAELEADAPEAPAP